MTTRFPPLTDAERALYLSGQPVEAVRQYRTRTGLGLEDAYRAVFGTAPATTPAFGGYVALPQGSGDSVLVAWWTDGRAARFHERYEGARGAWVSHWSPLTPPDYAALFPAAASAPFGATAAAPWDRGPEPTQDRPDDAPDPGRDD